MSNELSLEELKKLLRAAAGVPEGVDLDAEILDTGFEALGYDSLALLETSSRIERAYGVQLSDAVVTEAPTPRLLIEAVNAVIADTPAA